MAKKVTQLKRIEAKTIKLGAVIGGDFQLAFGTLLNSQLPVKAGYALLQVNDSVLVLQRKYEELRLAILNKYAEKGTDGKLLMNEDKTSYLITDRTNFDKEYTELLNLDVELTKIPMSCAEGTKLTPAMLQILVKTILDPEL